MRILGEGNNGLYTNEWLLADTKTNEIAMFELGTHKTRLWRSSKDEWFGGTEGFYWGCNNAKDLQVRLETVPGLEGRPANVVFHPSDRDRTWLQLFDRKKGTIDADFGFLAFTTPPLAASHSLDAKFTTTAMARELTTWAKFGPPLGHAWEPTDGRAAAVPRASAPLIANDWTLLRARPAPTKERHAGGGRPRPDRRPRPTRAITRRPRAAPGLARDDPARRATPTPGWPPRSPTTRRSSPSSSRSRPMRRMASSPAADQDRLDVALFGPTSRYLAAVARRGGKDIPLSETRADLRSDEWYDIAAGKGVLVLAELRKTMGDAAFLDFMDDFGRAHAGRPAAHGRVLRRGREGPRQAPGLDQGRLAQRRRPGEARRRRPGPPRLRPVLGGRLLRAPARRDPDRLRHPRRGRRPARGRRHAPAQARRPLGQHPAYRSRPTATSPTTS